MKKNTLPAKIRSGPQIFVKRAKKLFIALSVIMIPALMVLLVFAFQPTENQGIYVVLSVLFAVCYIVLYGIYATHISMGTVLGFEVTDKVIHLITARKTFTYDAKQGCVKLKEHSNRFVGTFEAQRTRDSFVFYKHAPLSKFSDEQFTEDDMRLIFPFFDEKRAE